MKLKFMARTLLPFAILVSQASFATMPPKPAKCPDASAIRSVGIELVQRDNDGTWVGGVQANKYQTNDLWTFIVGKIPANNETDARTKALKSLNSLRFIQGPFANPQYNVWVCIFGNDM